MRQKNPAYMKEIEDFVDAYYARNHQSPSCREIADHTTLQRNAVHRYLVAMNDRGIIRYDGRTIRTRRMQSYDTETTSVGVIGTISCGPFTMEEEAVEQYVDLPTGLFGSGSFFILHASGDSMTGIGISSGDLVLIRRQEEARPGDIVAVYKEGEGTTLKRYKVEGDTAFLHPENSEYNNLPAEDCRVQGVAVWVFKKVS